MPQNNCLRFRGDIFAIDRIDNNLLGVASRSQNIKLIDPSTCKVLHNIYFDLLGEMTTAVAFHPTQDIMAIANGMTLYILNTTRRNIMHTINTHEGAITLLAFLEQTPYLICGTRNGRVIQYRYEGKSQISRLCSFPYTKTAYKKNIKNNYVSAIAHNNQYLACSGYGGAVTLLKFRSHAKKFSFEVSKSRVNALAFLDDKRIIFANIEGTIFTAKLRTNAAIVQTNTMQRDITQLLAVPKSSYVLIVSKSDTIMLFESTTNKIVTPNFLTFDMPVRKAIVYKEDELLVSLIDNRVLKISLGNKEILQEYLKTENILEALKLLEDNPMLQKSPEAAKIEELYKKLYSKVILQFIRTNNKDILEALRLFSTLKSKKDDYAKLQLSLENYSKLQIFYKEHKYALAYALCEKFPPLQYTPVYQKMEEHYKKSFTLAQKQLLLGRLDKAKELLEPFSTVHAKRPMIQLLLRQNKEFLAFLKAVSSREYERIAALVQKNPNFKEIPSYIALQNKTEEDLTAVKKLIDSGEITKATAMIKELQSIPAVKEELQRLYKQTLEANKLLHYYEKGNFKECYETLDANTELESMQLAQLLEKHWNKIVDRCELYALQGNIRAIKESFGELIHISTRRNKIGDLLRLSFHSKVKEELNYHRYKSAENLIYSYIDIFGMESEIQQLMKAFEKLSQTQLAITFTQQKHKKRNSWIYSDII